MKVGREGLRDPTHQRYRFGLSSSMKSELVNFSPVQNPNLAKTISIEAPIDLRLVLLTRPCLYNQHELDSRGGDCRF